ncbi:GntR family transcriptional regulator [Comamonas endophytica]|uniref:GntR family transcriptional regulator n=1 Tax=Comamonas endophytica TaxID=2949090 RepID=A0ABY6G729_9BURK|nr:MULTISPECIES: GntR family transcriptional regulator [unclassified Acidovorax]MCD2511457.1 GntR family transcriptional regulator [Acidovorax sp. D4N7]UYG50848.1 GntR family transcriptional regulator [Acidovorax sp. 5MLIR]
MPSISSSAVVLRSQPRYVQLAQTLLRDIESGRYPVGKQLPTEFELCEQFGVSRSTAREAVKRLVDLGLVVRQPRLGSIVQATKVVTGYRHSVAEVSDLYQYANETTLVIESHAEVAIDHQLAQLVEGTPGEMWLHLRGVRHTDMQSPPISVTQLWIHPAFRSVQGLVGPLKGAVHAAIEQQFGEVITEVQQEIQAVLLTREQADALGAEAGSAGLQVTRRYRNRLNKLVEAAVSVHPADRFSYTTVLRREWGVPANKATQQP